MFENLMQAQEGIGEMKTTTVTIYQSSTYGVER